MKFRASDITVRTIMRFISEHETFELDYLKFAIREAGGIMTIGPLYKVSDFLQDMVDHNELTYNPQTKTYSRVA